MTATSPTQSPLRRCGVLTTCTAALWAVLAGPAFWLAGTLGLEGLTYAALMCCLPGCLLFFAIPFFEFAKNKAYAFLAGSGLRMFVVLVATLVLQEFRADLGLKEFLSWLIAFYSVTLLVETLLIVKSPDVATAGVSSGNKAVLG